MKKSEIGRARNTNEKQKIRKDISREMEWEIISFG
jgi:hypothetical protein